MEAQLSTPHGNGPVGRDRLLIGDSPSGAVASLNAQTQWRAGLITLCDIKSGRSPELRVTWASSGDGDEATTVGSPQAEIAQAELEYERDKDDRLSRPGRPYVVRGHAVLDHGRIRFGGHELTSGDFAKLVRDVAQATFEASDPEDRDQGVQRYLAERGFISSGATMDDLYEMERVMFEFGFDHLLRLREGGVKRPGPPLNPNAQWAYNPEHPEVPDQKPMACDPGKSPRYVPSAAKVLCL